MTPLHQELGHSLLRDRRRIHRVVHSLASPKSFCTPKAPEKIFSSDEHFDRSFSFYRSGAQTTKKKGKNNESTNSAQENTNPTPAHRTGARRVDGRASPGNSQLRSYYRQPFIPWTTCRHCARRSLSVRLLNLMCRSNLPNWLLFTRVRGDS